MLADEVNLLGLEPDANHSMLPGRSDGDATFAARNDGEEYLVLFHGNSPSSISVDLSSAPGNVEVKWLDVYGAAWMPTTQLSGGSTVTLTRPGGLSQWDGGPDGMKTLAVAVLKVTDTDPDLTPPSVPADLSVSGETASELTLSWSPSTDNVGVNNYVVYRDGVQIATPSASTYTDTGLDSETSYGYTVSAVDAAGNASAQSAGVSGTTDESPYGFLLQTADDIGSVGQVGSTRYNGDTDTYELEAAGADIWGEFRQLPLRPPER